MPNFRKVQREDGLTVYECLECHAQVLTLTRRAITQHRAPGHVNPSQEPGEIRTGGYTNPNYGKLKAPGDGYQHPDSSGRWRLGKTPQERRAIDYLRAMRKMERLNDSYCIDRFLKEAFDQDGVYPGWKGKRSPLQRLAFAYHLRDWERVKLCAFQLAYDSLVRRRVAAYFDNIKSMESHLDDFINALEHEALADGELQELKLDLERISLN